VKKLANKRQRKKLQAKKNAEILKKAGYSKKDIKRLKNKTDQVKKIERQYKRNERAKKRYQELMDLGIDKKQARKMRYWGEEKYNKALAEIKEKIEREKKEKEENEKYLLIFWREKTNNFFDEEVISKLKHSLKYVEVSYLIKGIHDLMTTPPEHAIIGSALTVVTPKKHKNQLIRFYKNYDDGTFQSFNSYFLVYEGKASLRRYRELLVNIYTVLSLMYELTAKFEFMKNLIFRDLPQVNQKTAERLAHDLNFRRK
jgi:hypothetical protein